MHSTVLIEDIRIEGLQRVSLGSVLDTVPVTIGDKIDETDYQRIIRTLFSTGQFDDIQLRAEGNILYVKVQERPTISSIKIDGNSAIKTEDLLGALGSEGISEGSVFAKRANNPDKTTSKKSDRQKSSKVKIIRRLPEQNWNQKEPLVLFIQDEDASDPSLIVQDLDVAESLRDSISRLPEREGRILALRYGFYDGVPRTLEEIGEEFDLTRERIRQLEKLALCRLRHPSFGIREQDLV